MISEDKNYTTQLLFEKGIHIYSGKDRILKMDEIYGKIPECDSSLFCSNKKSDKNKNKILKTLKEVHDCGFEIISKKKNMTNEKLYYPGQSVFYKLRKLKQIPHPLSVSKIPPNHKVEYDPERNSGKLLGPCAGPNYFGSWVNLTMGAGINLPNNMPINEKPFKCINDIIMRKIDKDYDIKYFNVKVKEIPVLITKNRELVCIPNLKDEINFACVGLKGSGKTMLSHSILDRMHHKFKKRIGIINDSLMETQSWSREWQKIPQDFSRKLSYVGEESMPLPLVYLHPTNKSLKSVVSEGKLGFKFSLQTEKMIDDWDTHFNGLEDWMLGKSKKYISANAKEISECKTNDELQELLESIIPNKPEGVFGKVSQLLREVAEEKILDSFSGQPSLWKIKIDNKEYELPPFTACMAAGIVPSLITSHIKSKKYFPQYLKIILQDLWERQNQMIEPFGKEKLLLFCDEITKVAPENQNNVASEMISTIVAEGRMSKIGLGWATQNPELVSHRIYDNTLYLFCFRFNNSDQINKIITNYGLYKSIKEDMQKLDKLECMAITSEHFIVYDENGKKRKDKGPFKGYIIPPLSEHSKPGDLRGG